MSALAEERNPGFRPHLLDEVMRLVPLPVEPGADENVKRYAGLCPAWLPGMELPLNSSNTGKGKGLAGTPVAAYGGHVYTQAGLAACYAVRAEERRKGINTPGERLGFHTIHGYFTSIGLADRPYVYAASYITTGTSFVTLRVDARQPTTPSARPHVYPFPLEDVHKPLGRICMTVMVSFKSPAPHSGGMIKQEASVQERFSEILGQRRPEEWPHCPSVDLELINRAFGADLETLFPMIEMRKVGMTEYNETKGPAEKRDLILYRLRKPEPGRKDPGPQHEDFPLENAHALVHAYGADRNGIPMLMNQYGMREVGKAASLSYSYTVHTNVDETVFEGDGWWVQETHFPRVGYGRGIVTSKIWSPAGVHVASTYQDALGRVADDEESKMEKAKRKAKGKI